MKQSQANEGPGYHTTVSVLGPGSACRIRTGGGDPVPGMVLSVCLYARGRLCYQVAWWDGRRRQIEWLEECEVAADETGPLNTIGFHATPPRPDPPGIETFLEAGFRPRPANTRDVPAEQLKPPSAGSAIARPPE